MSELSLTSPEEYQNGKKMSLSYLFLSKFRFFCSFIISHPFYFSYLLFFSPNIFKILSFLSPIFLTTTLLILALLTTLHVPDSESLETQPSFLFTFCSSFLEPKFDANDEGSNSLEMYKMVVEASSMECASANEITFVDKFCSHESTVSDAVTDETHNELVEIQPLKFKDPMDIEKEEETEKCEKQEEKEEKVIPKSGCEEQPTKQESKIQKVEVVGDRNDLRKLSDFLEGVEKKDEVITEKEEEEEEEVALRSVGSMRKEKEWRRTLACKLFEERHNAYVGMDELWETYETETEKKQNEEESKKKKKSMMKTKSIEKKEVVEEEEEDEDGIDQQQLCCLRALKFSTGKMHLGIARRPNLLKLSKAFKGFGKFYNATKYPKKV